MEKFCPKCGKDVESLIAGLCKDCFLEKKKPAELPARIEFEKCKACGKVKFKGKWLEESQEALKALALQGLRNKMFDSFKPSVEFFEKPEGFKAVVSLEGKVQGVELSQRLESLLSAKTVLCDSCMKLKSNYFEATVQVRFEKKPSQEIFESLLESADAFLRPLQRQDSLASIAKVQGLKNGMDLTVGSNRAAKRLAQFLASKSIEKVKVSSTLAGVDKSGHEKLRYTYCVRL